MQFVHPLLQFRFILYDCTKCSLQVVTSYSHVTEDEAYVFRLQKLCLAEKVHKLKQLSLGYFQIIRVNESSVLGHLKYTCAIRSSLFVHVICSMKQSCP